MIDIDAVIKNSKYSKKDLKDATNGMCGTFALALHNYLTKNNIPHQIILFVQDPHYPPQRVQGHYSDNPGVFWHHVAIKVDNKIYDIRGLVDEYNTHAEFNTDYIVDISKSDLIWALKRLNLIGKPHYSKSKYSRWVKQFPKE